METPIGHHKSFMPADSEGLARLRRRVALILRVPLHQYARDVVAVVTADVGPPLPAGALEEVNGLPGTLEAQLLGRELHRILVIDELPDPVRGQDHVDLIGRLDEQLLILGLPEHAVARHVPEGSGHGETREVGSRQIDAPIVLLQLAHLASSGLEPGLLLGQVRLVVPRAVDQARVVPVVRSHHNTSISNVCTVEARAVKNNNGPGRTRRVNKNVVLLGEAH
mmetsp:Transcript_112623/g.319367  ORF Transcript_112623/g.319367 Transcript_112623/m.319367 type:complete len:223 (+) Transcript_112623:234-902(+)